MKNKENADLVDRLASIEKMVEDMADIFDKITQESEYEDSYDLAVEGLDMYEKFSKNPQKHWAIYTKDSSGKLYQMSSTERVYWKDVFMKDRSAVLIVETTITVDGAGMIIGVDQCVIKNTTVKNVNNGT